MRLCCLLLTVVSITWAISAAPKVPSATTTADSPGTTKSAPDSTTTSSVKTTATTAAKTTDKKTVKMTVAKSTIKPSTTTIKTTPKPVTNPSAVPTNNRGTGCHTGTAIVGGNPFSDASGECGPGSHGQYKIGSTEKATKGVFQMTSSNTQFCCELHETDLCPGGLRPVGFAQDGQLYDFQGNTTALKENCTKLGADAFFFYNDKMCCPKGRLSDDALRNRRLSPTNYQKYSADNKECLNDEECGEGKLCEDVISSSNSAETGKKKICFPSIPCPSKTDSIWPHRSVNNTFICREDSDCTELTPCMFIGTDSNTMLADNTKQCCPISSYNVVCTAETANSQLVTKPGTIIKTSESECKSDETKIRVLTFMDDKNVSKACCEYEVEEESKTKLSEKCQNGGAVSLDKNHNPLPCKDLEKKRLRSWARPWVLREIQF